MNLRHVHKNSNKGLFLFDDMTLWVIEANLRSHWNPNYQAVHVCSTRPITFCLEGVNPFTPKIQLVILLTICHTILMMLVQRIWYWIN